MNKIIIAANRLPVKLSRQKGKIEVHPSSGGLATGLSSLESKMALCWVGWPGISVNKKEEREAVEKEMEGRYNPVYMNLREVKNFYHGFSNETIWPLFHCFTEGTEYNKTYWKYYQEINQRFCDTICEVAEEGDIIWVQDYHLMLLPGMLKEKLPDTPVGFFLHIPFPSYELFRALPWREEILMGMLGADLIGFHTFEYLRHFYSAVYRVLGHENRMGTIHHPLGTTQVDAFPMGINFEKFHNSRQDKQVSRQINRFKEKFGNYKLILSVDRLDYTKGILHRLKAFKQLLDEQPSLINKVSLIMIVVPSRDKVPRYKKLKENIDEMVGKINGDYATLEWTPVHYFYRSVAFDKLIALYNLCDIGLVTPLRDGMNLVAKEYVASKQDNTGVLILSEMAGSAIEMEEALKVNPNNQDAIVQALYKAIHMSVEEQAERIDKMQHVLKVNTVYRWAESFVERLERSNPLNQKEAENLIKGKKVQEIDSIFKKAQRPLVVLDYDGTLVPFAKKPQQAFPDEKLCTLLWDLCERSTVVVVSGRDHQTLGRWLGHLPVDLIAEHGLWVKEAGEWEKQAEINDEWKSSLRDQMEEILHKTPGSLIEEKSFSMAFHYRNTDNFLAELRIPELIEKISPLCSRFELEILRGKKVIEIRTTAINKGKALENLLNDYSPDFCLIMGDDRTDEDMFAVAPQDAFTIKVGEGETLARLRIDSCKKVMPFLEKLKNARSKKNLQKLRPETNTELLL